MILVFDTSSFSQILAGNKSLARIASGQRYTRHLLPLAADAELRFGFAHGNREQANLALYEKIKGAFNITVKEPDQDTALVYTELAGWCRKKGVSLSHNDLWVASATVQSGGRLLTLDQDFECLPQLSLISKQ